MNKLHFNSYQRRIITHNNESLYAKLLLINLGMHKLLRDVVKSLMIQKTLNFISKKFIQ